MATFDQPTDEPITVPSTVTESTAPADSLRPLRLLLVEDSPDDAALLLRILCRSGYDVACERVETADEMAAALRNATWDLVLADYVLPSFSGLAALRVLHHAAVDLPFIMISGAVGEEAAVASMKAGAHDFVTKGNLTRLVPAIERELREADIRHERAQIREQLRRSQKLDAAGRIAAGMAHEFNNQLTVIKGSVEFLLSNLRDSDPRRRDAERIGGAVDRGA